jgi:integrase
VQRSQAVKAGTVNRELPLLKHMLTKAVKLPKEPPGRLRYLELEEIERLLDACDDPQNSLKVISI